MIGSLCLVIPSVGIALEKGDPFFNEGHEMSHVGGGRGGGEHEMRSGGCGPVSGPSWARSRAPRTDLLRNAMVKSKMHRFWADFGSRGRQIVGVLKSE